MSNHVSLEQVEQQVTQLPTQDQLKLVAFISQHLLASSFVAPSEDDLQERTSPEQTVALNDWLAECEQVADLWEGEFDAGADLQRIRHEEK